MGDSVGGSQETAMYDQTVRELRERRPPRPLENYQIVMRIFEEGGWREQIVSVRDLAYAMRGIIRYDEATERDDDPILRGALNLLKAGENMADGCRLSYEECVALRRLLRSLGCEDN